MSLLTICSNKVIKFQDNQDDIDCLLTNTTCIKVVHDTKQYDYIKVVLPNNQMANSGLTSRQQQDEIDKCIQRFTKGKNSIEWSMIGIENAMDVIHALERYKELNETYFSKMIGECCIENTSMMESDITFYLDERKMLKSHPEWEYELCRGFEKSRIFHKYESVIINRKHNNENNNTNKYKNKNKNQHKSKNINTKNTNKNERKIPSTNKNNQIIDNIDLILDTWDMEIGKIHSEWKKDKLLESSNVFNESFGMLKEIEREAAKLTEPLREREFVSYEMDFKQLGRHVEMEMTLKEDIQMVKNKIKLIVDHVNDQETTRNEREKILHDKNVCENVFDQNKKEKVGMIGSLKVDTINIQCDTIKNVNSDINKNRNGKMQSNSRENDNDIKQRIIIKELDNKLNLLSQSMQEFQYLAQQCQHIIEKTKEFFEVVPKYDMVECERIESKILLNSKNVEKIFDVVIVNIDCMIKKLEQVIHMNYDCKNSNFNKNMQVIECEINKNSNNDNNGNCSCASEYNTNINTMTNIINCYSSITLFRKDTSCNKIINSNSSSSIQILNIQAANITTMMIDDLLFKSDTNLCNNNSIVLDFSLERIINISWCRNTGNLDLVGNSVQELKQTRYEYKFYDDNG